MIRSNYPDFKTDGTTIQMFPNSTVVTEIDKQMAIQLVQAAVELIKPSINASHLDDQIAKKFSRVHEAIVSAYLGSIIE